MIADIQTQELVVVATEQQQQFNVVKDLELMFVSGGGASATLF